MGKNAHPPRSHGKKPAPRSMDVPDSNVVFTNDTDDKKSKKAPKQQTQEAPPSDAPKKPSTKELIGGASWTGKLPVNLLAEHCQRLQWYKPEYLMVQ